MILFAILKILLSQTVTLGPVEAAPITFSNNPTTNGSSPSYVKEPPGRGTMGLFLSSVITLTLCVYTSIHLNIAPDNYMLRIPIHRLNPIPIFKKDKKSSSTQTTKEKGFGIKRATVYKFHWVLIALVAPEFVLFAALNQWNEAKALLKALKKLDVPEGSTPPDEVIPADEVRESFVPSDDNTPEDESREGLMPPDDDIAADESRESLTPPDDDIPAEEIRGILTPPDEEISVDKREEILPSTNEVPQKHFLDLLCPTIPVSAKHKKWADITMASAFFVIMGGVAYRRGLDFEIRDEELDFPYLMLNPTGFLELAKKKVLHPGILDNRSIVDRSKADSLAKLLVCAQAFWMVLNVITRKLDGLPNTLIELNVVVHVVVMVVVYGLWWEKPLGVATPIILNPSINSHDGEFQSFSDDAEDTRALVSLHREILSLHHCDGPMKYVSSEKIDTSWGMKSWLLGQSHYWYWLPIYKDFDLKYLESDVNHREYKDLLGYTVQIPENTDLEFKILEICTAEKIPARKEQERKVKVADLQLNSERHSEGLLLLPGKLLVWNGLGGNSRRLYFGSHCRSKSNPYFITKSYMLQLRNLYFHSYGRTPHGSSCKFATSDPTNMVVDGGISNWSENGSSNWLPAPILTIGATILSILYAGCHATAWSAHFPTFTERYF